MSALPPSRLEVAGVTSDSVKLFWRPPPATNIEQYEIQYSEPGQPWNIVFTNSNSNSYNVINLTPSTKYAFRVRAMTYQGCGQFCDYDHLIQTNEGGNQVVCSNVPKLEKPLNPTVSKLLDGKVKVMWSMPSQSCDISDYELSYRDRQSHQWTTNTTQECPTVVGPLNEGRQYIFRVRALIMVSGDCYAGPFSDESIPYAHKPQQAATINISPPQRVPQHIQPPNRPVSTVHPLNSTFEQSRKLIQQTLVGRSLKPDPPPRPSSENTPKQIKSMNPTVSVPQTVPITDDDNDVYESINPQGEYQFYTIPPHQQGSKYEDKHQTTMAHTRKNIQAPSIPKYDDEDLDSMARPHAPNIESVTAECVVLTWNYPRDVDLYEVRYRTNQTTKWLTQETNDCRITIERLQSNTEYHFQIQAFQGEMASIYSESTKVTTSNLFVQSQPKQSRREKPSNLQHLSSTENSITVAWQYDQDCDKFEVRYRKCGTNTWMVDEIDLAKTIKLTNLDSNEDYECKVRAVSEEAMGPYSDISTPMITELGMQKTHGKQRSRVQTPTHNQKPPTITYAMETVGKPKANTTDSGILVQWTKPRKGASVTSYELQYKECGTGAWMMVTTDDTEEMYEVDDVKPGQKYEFRVRAVYNDRVGPFSDISRPILFRQEEIDSESDEDTGATQGIKSKGFNPVQPTYLDIYECTTRSISLNWYVTESVGIKYFEIQYHQGSEIGWQNESTKDATTDHTINELQSDTEYQVRVCAVYNNSKQGPFSTISHKAKTLQSLAHLTLEMSELISNETPAKHLLKVQELYTNRQVKTRLVSVGQPNNSRVAIEKTIMVVGATGAGKSTLINGMANYIFDVGFDDSFRFVLVDHSLESGGSQAKSQTEYITHYRIHQVQHGTVPYKLNIIDTPGFGDTRGIVRDKQLTAQIKELFEKKPNADHNILTLDAVCFVCAASQARLTPTQKYIIDSILSVFGKDIKDNIVVLATFSDGSEPAVIASLKEGEVPYINYFCFNNSALFENNTQTQSVLTKTFWNIGVESFNKFFRALGSMSPKSLQLTNRVLTEREHLETTVVGLQKHITEGLSKLEALRTEERLLDEHNTKRKGFKNFKYTVNDVQINKILLEPKTYVTNCLECNRTCHDLCHVQDDEKKYKCSSMNYKEPAATRRCRICQPKCTWDLHKNMPYRIEIIDRTVEKTYKDMEKQYKDVNGKIPKAEEMIAFKKKELECHKKKVLDMINTVADILTRLREIALKPNPLTKVDYIDLLINSEEQDPKPGWQDRRRALQTVRAQAVIVQEAEKRDVDVLMSIAK